MSSVEIQTPARKLPLTRVSPFPRARFLEFIRLAKVLTKDFGLVPMNLLGTQTYVLDEMCDAIGQGVTTFYILKARQLGMTTFFILIDLFWAMENKGLLGAFVTHTDVAKANFRNVIKVFLAHLPRSHKIRWEQENRDMIVLKNSSLLQYLVAGTKEKSKGGLGRSSANNFIHATEVAFWGSPDDLYELSATMSLHYPHRLYIEETTANGYNFWEERWRDGKNDKTIRCIFVGWWRHDHYTLPDDHPWFGIYMPKGHQTRLSARERRGVDAVFREYGVAITLNQIAWYRYKLEAELKGDQEKMDEQFPFVEDDAFVATGSQFFEPRALSDAMKRARAIPFLPFKYTIGTHWAETVVVSTRDRSAQLRVWEEARANGHYAIGCDPAYGSSETADRTVIGAFRCYADRLVQVAEFVSPVISTYQCAWVLCHLAGYYSNCMVNLEINGPGTAVFDEMNRLRSQTPDMVSAGETQKHDPRAFLMTMRNFLYSRADSLSQSLAYQWRTSGNNKPGMMSSFKDSFELRAILINSLPLLDEMKTVIIDGGVIEAELGKKDDRVIAAALAHEAWRRWIRPRLANMNLTYEASIREDSGRGIGQAEKMAINYLRQQGIAIPGSNSFGASDGQSRSQT